MKPLTNTNDTTMKTKDELIKEAIARGIKPGAVIKTMLGDTITVPEPQLWSMNEDGCLYIRDGWRCVLMYGEWATVITPAPEDQPQGLVDGMACEPDEHMRAAIVEKAKELRLAAAYSAGNHYPALVWFGQMEDCKKRDDCSTVGSHWITPGEFYDRLCKTAKPEPPIRIGGHDVKFDKGEITVGCTTVPNDIVRKVYERLKD